MVAGSIVALDQDNLHTTPARLDQRRLSIIILLPEGFIKVDCVLENESRLGWKMRSNYLKKLVPN